MRGSLSGSAARPARSPTSSPAAPPAEHSLRPQSSRKSGAPSTAASAESVAEVTRDIASLRVQPSSSATALPTESGGHALKEDEEVDADDLDADNGQGLTVTQLRAALSAMGLQITGPKRALADRLLAAVSRPNVAAAAGPAATVASPHTPREPRSQRVGVTPSTASADLALGRRLQALIRQPARGSPSSRVSTARRAAVAAAAEVEAAEAADAVVGESNTVHPVDVAHTTNTLLLTGACAGLTDLAPDLRASDATGSVVASRLAAGCVRFR